MLKASREAWKRSRRDLPLSTLRSEDREHDEEIELAGNGPDPITVALERDDVRRRLVCLTDREREFLALQALGLSYSEIAQATGSSLRTVERQVLRARHKLQSVDDD